MERKEERMKRNLRRSIGRGRGAPCESSQWERENENNYISGKDKEWAVACGGTDKLILRWVVGKEKHKVNKRISMILRGGG